MDFRFSHRMHVFAFLFFFIKYLFGWGWFTFTLSTNWIRICRFLKRARLFPTKSFLFLFLRQKIVSKKWQQLGLSNEQLIYILKVSDFLCFVSGLPFFTCLKSGKCPSWCLRQHFRFPESLFTAVLFIHIRGPVNNGIIGIINLSSVLIWVRGYCLKFEQYIMWRKITYL